MRKQCCQIRVQVADWATFKADCHFIKLCFIHLLKYLAANLAYFKRLRSETEIEKMTMTDEPYVQECRSGYFSTLPLTKNDCSQFFNFCGSVACLFLHFIILKRQNASFIAITLPTLLELIVPIYSVLLFLRY